MEYGKVVFAGPLTADYAAVLGGVRMPSGLPGTSGGAYFCLSDLARHWPSKDAQARREVVMVTNGLGYYQAHFDRYAPDVMSAIADSARAGLVVYSIYWAAPGPVRRGSVRELFRPKHPELRDRRNRRQELWMGTGDPVSFRPYFDELNRRFRNQYELGFVGSGRRQIGSGDLEGEAQRSWIECRRAIAGSGEPWTLRPVNAAGLSG